MKKFLCILILSISVLLGINASSASAEVMGGGTNNPVTPGEVEIGVITGFAEEDGDFGTTVYYVKMQNSIGREVTYPLADKTYLNYELMKAEDVYEALKTGNLEIAYVVRGEKIKYINPCIIHYDGNKSITVNKGSDGEITVKVFGSGENTEVKWTSDSKIIFEFIETSGTYNETVKIKGRIVGEATLTATLTVDGEARDSVDVTINVSGSVISAGTNKPVMRDEIQSGMITGFDVVDGDFDTTVYYLKIKAENGEESIFELAENVIFTEGVYTAEDSAWILQNSESEITFVLRSGKIKYINPYVPQGLFESAVIEDCYSVDGTLYGYLSFEYLVGECVCVVAVYDENSALCSVSRFDVSYKDAYSYDFEAKTNNGQYIKVMFLEGVTSMKPLEAALTAQIDIVR